ncbi:hypothetical protein [Asaia platycodi]|uniref:hypothetical protein n=1 Tax=Asaia platycodi TaxID=610243 RepID=UPI000A7B76CF|nr:hypothetical protein [Asaia platycodi]
MPIGTPVIVSTHIPLVTAVEDYAPPPGKPPAHQARASGMPIRCWICSTITT